MFINELFKQYVSSYGMSEYDANLITENKESVELFESILKHSKNLLAVQHS